MSGIPVLFKPLKLPILEGVPHAIPYQGSKRALAHAVIPLLPPGTDTLIEPFAGSAAVTIAARYSASVRSSVISDANEPLMALWDLILAAPSVLADGYEGLWCQQQENPRGFYDEVRAKFNVTEEPHLLLYLLARCVKAAVRYDRNGSFNQSPDNRRLGAAPLVVRRRLMGTANVLAGATVVPGDYTGFLAAAGKNDVVYLDPPYQGVSGTHNPRYLYGLDRYKFESHLQDAVNAGTSFILSYDAVTEAQSYGNALPDHLNLTHFHVISGRSSQATLQGVSKTTVESIYLSPALVERLGGTEQVVRNVMAGRAKLNP